MGRVAGPCQARLARPRRVNRSDAAIRDRPPLTSIAERTQVAPGVMMPRLGLGTWKAHFGALERTISQALALGYRLLDTSPVYFNEREVGRAIARSGVPRDELFVTTKLDAAAIGVGTARRGLESSLARMGLDYVDLYLIHWPRRDLINRTWHAMEELQRAGLTRAIGVSNFAIGDLETLLDSAEIVPAVNQVELNPLVQRRDIQTYCRDRDITLEAWAPVLQGSATGLSTLVRIGERKSKTPSQVSLRWILQKDVIAIPKTVHEARLRENADVYDFELTDAEMAEIDAI